MKRINKTKAPVVLEQVLDSKFVTRRLLQAFTVTDFAVFWSFSGLNIHYLHHPYFNVAPFVNTAILAPTASSQSASFKGFWFPLLHGLMRQLSPGAGIFKNVDKRITPFHNEFACLRQF